MAEMVVVVVVQIVSKMVVVVVIVAVVVGGGGMAVTTAAVAAIVVGSSGIGSVWGRRGAREGAAATLTEQRQVFIVTAHMHGAVVRFHIIHLCRGTCDSPSWRHTTGGSAPYRYQSFTCQPGVVPSR